MAINTLDPDLDDFEDAHPRKKPKMVRGVTVRVIMNMSGSVLTTDTIKH
jgi:hypothetical protein